MNSNKLNNVISIFMEYNSPVTLMLLSSCTSDFLLAITNKPPLHSVLKVQEFELRFVVTDIKRHLKNLKFISCMLSALLSVNFFTFSFLSLVFML